ncbi:MAG: HAD hydrolase-like protein [Defluviitaleaceae bacterium]|nr:HAD hydrolase-like protein [Defluviitaleaceae bacterium]
MMLSKYTNIIWDWNGTILNDVEWCLTVINTLLVNRGIAPIKDIKAYRDIFGFPVIDYYRRAGFDLDNEPFEIPAAEFIKLYHSDNRRFCLFDNAVKTLNAFNKMGLKQIILSASEVNNLRSQTSLFDIEYCFDEIIGISNIYAKSKVDAGQEYISRSGLDKSKAVLIGDTIHDYEVAKTLGVDCFLISQGHQHKHKLLECGIPVFDDIKSIVLQI